MPTVLIKAQRNPTHQQTGTKQTVCFAQDWICCILPSVFYLSFFHCNEQPLCLSGITADSLTCYYKAADVAPISYSLEKIFLLRVSTFPETQRGIKHQARAKVSLSTDPDLRANLNWEDSVRENEHHKWRNSPQNPAVTRFILHLHLITV